MKSLVMVLVGIMLSVSAVSAAGNKKESKEPFTANVSQLSSYLQLNAYQTGEVEQINDYFIEMQRKSLRAKPERQEEQMHKAVYGNLKLMRRVLDDEQYRKYVIMLNVTNNNNRVINVNALVDNEHLVSLDR